MAGSLNKVILIGNLGRDPEVKSTPSGVKVANFSMATTERYTDKQGQKVEKTEWHRIVAWRGIAEIIERYLKKGSMICIEGKLTTRSWDGEDGKKNYITEIVADSMKMLGGKTSGDSSGQQSPAPGAPPAPEDDLPF